MSRFCGEHKTDGYMLSLVPAALHQIRNACLLFFLE